MSIQSPKAEVFYVMREIEGEECVAAAHSTVGGAIAHRNVLHIEKPFAALSIWSSITGIVQPLRTLAQRRQYGDYYEPRKLRRVSK